MASRRRRLALALTGVLVAALPVTGWVIRINRDLHVVRSYDLISKGMALNAIDELGIHREERGYPSGTGIPAMRDDAGDGAEGSTVSFTQGGKYQIVIDVEPTTNAVRGKRLCHVHRPSARRQVLSRWFPF